MESARSYYIDVLTTIGEMQTKDSGSSSGDSSADDNLTAGRQALSRWMVSGAEGLDGGSGDAPLLSINPKYGFRFAETEDENNDQGPLIRSDTDVSFPVSNMAKLGLAPDTVEDPQYLSGLPAHSICG